MRGTFKMLWNSYRNYEAFNTAMFEQNLRLSGAAPHFVITAANEKKRITIPIMIKCCHGNELIPRHLLPFLVLVCGVSSARVYQTFRDAQICPSTGFLGGGGNETNCITPNSDNFLLSLPQPYIAANDQFPRPFLSSFPVSLIPTNSHFEPVILLRAPPVEGVGIQGAKSAAGSGNGHQEMAKVAMVSAQEGL